MMSLETPIPYAELRPVQRGWVRGLVRGLVQEMEVTEYGRGVRWTFEVAPREGGDPVAVEMRGLDSVGQLLEDSLVEVYVGGTKERPVRTNYLWAPTVEQVILTFYPGEPTPKRPGEDSLGKWPIVFGVGVAVIAAIVAAAWVLW